MKQATHVGILVLLVHVAAALSGCAGPGREEAERVRRRAPTALPAQAGAAAKTSAATGEVSPRGYQQVRDELLAVVDAQDPKVALTRLRSLTSTDVTVLRLCHPLGHEIGRRAYEKYKDFGEAMKYQDEVCNSPYLHGIIESHFAGSSDVFAAMKTVCNNYPLESFISWECYHGVGHGAMFYTRNDLPQSLALCDSYDIEFARSSCVNGVFMENFNTDQKMHPSIFLRESDPFYPCAEQDQRHKGDCYLYAPTYYLNLHKQDYRGALEWCTSAEQPFRRACALGVGSQAIKEHLHDPKSVEAICMGGRAEQVAPCVTGLATLYTLHHAALEPTRAMCEQLDASNREACGGAVQALSKFFAG